MKINELKVENFRNIENETVIFSPDTNLIWGSNAEGKTNIIEAIYYFANSKSFRASKDSDLIKFGENEAKLTAIFEEGGRECRYDIKISKNEKRSFYYNGIKISKMSDFFGNFRAVLFVPEHLKTVKNGPGERRSFIDGAICQLKKSYISDLYRFSKLLSEKNAVLREYVDNAQNNALLDVYDESLIPVMVKISKTRREYVKELFLRAERHLFDMSGDKMSYEFKISGVLSEENEEEFFRRMLRDTRKKDVLYKTSTAGSQRDDFEIKLSGVPLRQYGSQGQQRSAVIALKLAEGEIAEETKKSAPIYLFDDILSELDARRREYILKRLDNKQVIITSCLGSEEGIYSGKKIFVEKGKYT